jgi:putative spermidine/putrescine transport system permease protein
MTTDVNLRRQLRRSRYRQQAVAILLVLPLFAFLAFSFILPLAGMVWRSMADPEVGRAFPQTLVALSHWDAHALPEEATYKILASELARARDGDTLALAARRLNYDIGGFRSVLFTSARKLPGADSTSFKDAMIATNPAWGDIRYWGAIRNAGGPATLFYLLSAVDLTKSADGAITMRSGEDAIFISIFLRTFQMAGVVTLICLIFGFPVAYLLANLPEKLAYPMLICVLVPFWTSLLVRTAAWVVLLQNNGIVNDALRSLHVIQEPLALIYNRTGVNFSMTHILLPFLILPLYSVMRGISPTYMKAAASLGAHPARAFIKIYLPQCSSGIAAGCLLVFTIALGFYVTPALVGGAADQMVSYFIAFYTNTSANWGLACALSVWLLAISLVLYGVYARLVNVVPGLST